MKRSGRAGLSYSLPGVRPGEYYDAAEWLLDLKHLGFACVTFTPSYLAHDELPLRIEPQRGPKLDALARATGFALAAGFTVQIDPHLRWESTGSRQRMYFNPFEAYFEGIIAPIAAMVASAACERCSLTLGSGLDVSLAEFSQQWLAVAREVLSAAPKIKVGHEVSAESTESADRSTMEALNGERKRRRLPPLSKGAYERQAGHIGLYLRQLDYVSLALYQTRPGPGQLKALRQIAGERSHLRIGEFGASRRAFCQEFLQMLSKPGCEVDRVTFHVDAATDFLGVLGNDDVRDDVLRAAFRRYNEAEA